MDVALMAASNTKNTLQIDQLLLKESRKQLIQGAKSSFVDGLTGLPVSRRSVSPAFVSSQIDERELSEEGLLGTLAQDDLEDCVRSGRRWPGLDILRLLGLAVLERGQWRQQERLSKLYCNAFP